MTESIKRLIEKRKESSTATDGAAANERRETKEKHDAIAAKLPGVLAEIADAVTATNHALKDGGQEEYFIHERKPSPAVDILHLEEINLHSKRSTAPIGKGTLRVKAGSGDMQLQFSSGTSHGTETMNILSFEKEGFEELLTRYYDRVTTR